MRARRAGWRGRWRGERGKTRVGGWARERASERWRSRSRWSRRSARPREAVARLEGVNNPSLLPPGEPAPVLDVAGYLGKSDIARLTREVEALERDTGMKLRVLAQAYPQTPGLAVKEYWNVDDDTVVPSPTRAWATFT